MPPLNEKDMMRLSEILAEAERDLSENVLPFWTRNTWDKNYGGFITHLNRAGNRTGVTDKYLVMQARTIWSLSAAHRFGLRDKGYLELAEKGVSFLIEKMWDSRHGGFFWAVKRNGMPKDTRKRIVGLAYVIYALAEYASASKDGTSLEVAEDTFNLIHQKAADNEYGFLEVFTRDWKPHIRSWLQPRTLLGKDDGSYKSLNTHMHLMEAFTRLAQITRKPGHELALRKVTDLILTKAIHPRYGYAIEHFHRDWTPRISQRIPFGHGVELSWLLLDAEGALHAPTQMISQQVLGLVDCALTSGFDTERGGLATYGLATGKGTERTGNTFHTRKVWWVQAEMLLALLQAFRLRNDRKYIDAFEKQFAWIWEFQIDHEGGDWFAETDWYTGKPMTFDKGNAWKTLYHNSRALMRVSQMLRAWKLA
jgi:mannose 2-epimerase